MKSDDELAAVLAHEIAHALAHHARESTSTWVLASPLLVPSLLIEFAIPVALLGLAYFVYMTRRQEKEADYIGTLLMASAGFDPSATVSYYKNRKMEVLGGDPRIQQALEWMHPDVS